MEGFRLAVYRVCLLVVFLEPTRVWALEQSETAAQPATAVSRDFEQAKILLGQGSVEDALSAVDRGLERMPRSVDGLNLLGMIYHQQQRYAESEAAFKKALSVDPRSVETLNNLAISYTTQKKFELAERTFRRSLLLSRADRAAIYNLSQVLLAIDKPKEAIAELRRLSPADAGTRLMLLQAYLRAGETAQGMKTAQELSARAGKDVKLHFSLGVVLASEKQYGPAIREFEVANALAPRSFEILHNLGQAYLRNNQPSKAQPPLEEALRVEPGSAEALFLLAQSETDQKRDVEALELLVRARKIAPQNTDILLLMSRLSMKQSFYEDAIALLEEAIKIDPKRADLHAALGESLFSVGKVPQALGEFKLLLQLEPSARSYALMGLCYRHLGRFDEAKQYLHLGLGIDPNDPLTLFNLGFIAKRQGNNLQAEQYLSRALRVDRRYSDALYELGGLKMEQKKYGEAVPLLRRSAETSTRPAEAYYKLALAERSLHQSEAAQRDMKVFVTLSKNPQPGPFPRQNFFEYLNRRASLSPLEKAQTELKDLETEVKQHPDRPRSLYLLAEAYLNVNRSSDAIEIIERLDKLSDADVRTLLAEGVLLARFHLYPAAIQHFQAALHADQGSDEARYNLAEAFFQLHDDANALKSLEQVSPQAQKDDAYLALLGDVYARLGRTEEAVAALRKAIATSPDNDQYYLSLGLAEMRVGDAKEAYATLKRGLARVPDSAMLHWGLGVVSVLRGQATDAETYLKHSVDLAPSRESALMSLGIFYYETGRIGEAREVLDRYAEIFPSTSIDLSSIRRALAAPPQPGVLKNAELSAHARQEFYQFAIKLAEEDR